MNEERTKLVNEDEERLDTTKCSLCDTVTSWGAWCWYSIVDKERRELMVTSAKLQHFNKKMHELIVLNGEALARTHGEVRCSEEELKQDMNVFLARLVNKQQLYQARCLQRGAPTTFTRNDIESWLDSDDLALQFKCMQHKKRIGRLKQEIVMLYNIQSTVHEHMSTAHGWQLKMRSNEHLRAMSGILKDIDKTHMRNLSNMCVTQVEELVSRMDKIGDNMERDELDDVADDFWGSVLASAVQKKDAGVAAIAEFS